METELESLKKGVNTVLLLVSTAMIFLMQIGFALLECGTVRSKNSRNILIKNMLDACISVYAFWVIGYGLAFGEVNGGFIGLSPKYFASSGFGSTNQEAGLLSQNQFMLWMFQFSFAANASTIVSGCLAERA